MSNFGITQLKIFRLFFSSVDSADLKISPVFVSRACLLELQNELQQTEEAYFYIDVFKQKMV